jgi:hypothetical protein
MDARSLALAGPVWCRVLPAVPHLPPNLCALEGESGEMGFPGHIGSAQTLTLGETLMSNHCPSQARPTDRVAEQQ